MNVRFRYALITCLIASVPVALTVLSFRAEAERRPTTVTLGQVMVMSAAEWYPWVLVVPFIDARVRRSRPANRVERFKAVGGHAALCLTFGVAHGMLTHVARVAVGESEGSLLRSAFGPQLIPNVLLYTAIAAGFTIAEQRRRQTEIAERLRAEVAEARLDALRQQLNPHFLFNALNHIVVQLRSGEVAPAQRMLLSLSELLRDVLRERAQLIPLREEVRMVEQYLDIERARFGERLHAEVTFEPRTLDALVPSLLLQPLLENAMRHGISAADGRCALALTARCSADRLLIEVRDAGPGLDPSRVASATGIGLKNTSERLRYLYGGDHRFELGSLENGGLRVALDLPYRRV